MLSPSLRRRSKDRRVLENQHIGIRGYRVARQLKVRLLPCRTRDLLAEEYLLPTGLQLSLWQFRIVTQIRLFRIPFARSIPHTQICIHVMTTVVVVSSYTTRLSLRGQSSNF
jgi:hypothetical protein